MKAAKTSRRQTKSRTKREPKYRRLGLPPLAAPVVQLLTIKDCAGQLRLSIWAVRDLIKRGYLPAVRLPGKPRGKHSPERELHRVHVDARDLAAFVDRHRVNRTAATVDAPTADATPALRQVI